MRSPAFGAQQPAAVVVVVVVVVVLAAARRAAVDAWTTTAALAPTPPLSTRLSTRLKAAAPSFAAADNEDSRYRYAALLDFTNPTTIDVVDRLDDAIMGGISTSAVVPHQGCVKWFGVCREDGGGFCGWRTNPFRNPLYVSDYEGLYVVAQLASDDDVHRRVWKISTRTRPDRGEQLYQAPLVWPSSPQGDDKGWTTIRVPFDRFRLVRGPRVVPNGPPLDVTNGLYQIGMTMGKFVFAAGGSEEVNGTISTLPNFRPGLFQLNVREIGAYREETVSTPVPEATTSAANGPSRVAVAPPLLSPTHVFTKAEAQRQRSAGVRLLVVPLLRLAFGSEARQRRKSALRKWKGRYGRGTFGATLWALRNRARGTGGFRAGRRAMRIAVEEALRCAVGFPLRVALLYPLRLASWLSQRVSAPPGTEERARTK